MSDISSLVEKNDKIDKKIDALNANYAKLLTEKDNKIARLESELKMCRERVISQEQRSRDFCLRVKGVSIDKDLEKEHGHIAAAKDAAYSKVILPLIKKNPDLETPSSADDILENAHILPSKGEPGKQGKKLPPIILVRFRSKQLCDGVLRMRNELKTSAIPVNRNDKKAGVTNYWLTKDLTRDIVIKIQEMNEDERVEKCWFMSGKICFTLKSDTSKIIKTRKVLFNLADYC